ncbi:hypothetical protein [Kribbella sindirgiensis]|uniref:Uncharacterized protein n=1 Tax=Kribbella sindirgiensis TaxID=1124744 RepID=A0A4R0J161_9ACTN|nr:hypothetical protein [Kribbella sindirgiensis]TCC39377.1 hypothetical protein E0H50_05430 [Kribbella sindirgiensis]
MSTESIRREVLELFRSFFYRDVAARMRQEGIEPTTLSEVISVWLAWDESVISTCLGDYRNYLIGVIAIIEAWTRDPDTLLGHELSRQITSVAGDLDDRRIDDILDPHRFETIRFRQLYPHADSPTP